MIVVMAKDGSNHNEHLVHVGPEANRDLQGAQLPSRDKHLRFGAANDRGELNRHGRILLGVQ